MDILLGLSTLAATSLLLSFAYGAHRRAIPAKWTALPGLSMLTCVMLTLAGPVGFGFLIKGALQPLQELSSLSVSAVILTALLVALAVVASPLLIRPALRKSSEFNQPVADNNNVAPAVVSGVAA